MTGLGDALLAFTKRLSGQNDDPKQNDDERSPVDDDEIQYPTIQKRTIAERLRRREAEREIASARAGTDEDYWAEPSAGLHVANRPGPPPLYTNEKYGRGVDEHFVAAEAYLPKPPPNTAQGADDTGPDAHQPEDKSAPEPDTAKERPLRRPVYDQDARNGPNGVMRTQDIGRFLREGFDDRLSEMICKVSLLRAQVAHAREDYYGAYQKADHAMELATKIDYKPLEGRCYYWLGMGAYGLKEYWQAATSFENAKACQGRYFEGETAVDWQAEANRQADRAPGLSQINSLDSYDGTSLADELGDEEGQGASWASRPTGVSKEVPRQVQRTRRASTRFSLDSSDDEDKTVTTDDDDSFRSPDSAMMNEYLDGDMTSPLTTPEEEAARWGANNDRQDADTSNDTEDGAGHPEREGGNTIGLGLFEVADSQGSKAIFDSPTLPAESELSADESGDGTL